MDKETSIRSYIDSYLSDVKLTADRVNEEDVTQMILSFERVRERGGRLFVLGVGGSAANASHCVNDFRKIYGLECYAPTDNVAELTARINDESWEDSYVNWLKGSKMTDMDAILVLSVGGGSETTSVNLVRAIEYAKNIDCMVLSIVSRDGGKAKELSDVCVHIPVVNKKLVTAHAEEWQGIIWHLVVNYGY